MRLKLTHLFGLLLLVFLLGACEKKSAGPGGHNSVSGGITFKNGVSGNQDGAPYAKVSISYGTDQPTSSFDQTVLADATGRYSIGGLMPGHYFVKAEFSDAHGFKYTCTGTGITFENKDRNIEVNFVLE